MCRNFFTDFDEASPSLHWTYIRNPYRQNYRFCPESSRLILKGTEKTLSCPDDSPTFLGIRQKEFDICATAKLEAMPERESQRCGITAYYNDSYHYDLFVTKKEDRYYVCLGKRVHDIEVVTHEAKVDYNGAIELRIEADKDYYSFFYKEGDQFVLLGRGMTAGLCTECTHTMTFTGVFIGLYAVNMEAAADSFQVDCL